MILKELTQSKCWENFILIRKRIHWQLKNLKKLKKLIRLINIMMKNYLIN